MRGFFPDTSVLFPVRLINLIMRSHAVGVIEVVWTDELLDELTRVLQAKKGLTRSRADGIAERLRSWASAGRIDPTKYRHLTVSMTGPDADDHVHAAAASVAADVLLTANPGDFPERDLGRCRVLTPDALFAELATEFAREFALLLVDSSSALRSPSRTPPELLDDLCAIGLAGFADLVEPQLHG